MPMRHATAAIRKPDRSRAGYTLLELMIAAAVAATGLYASLNMATYALRGNTELRDANAALGLAEHLLATMQAEAVLWVTANPADSSPLYLKALPVPPTPGQASDWKIAKLNPYDKDKRVGELGDDGLVFDAGALQEVPSDRGKRYCVHYRLTWVGLELVRAEVRVSWARPHVPADAYISCPKTMIDDVANVSSVALAGSVMRNTSAQP
ncbi:MAG: hypothetical protein RIT45_3252 [Pseudomonadota bacterium]